MRLHPDAEFVKYLLRCITQEFRIGFDDRRCECRQAVANMTSADDNPTVVDECLAKEVALGRVVGPVNCEAGPQLQVNRFGVIPHQPGKWRLIVDLSHPRGSSVSNGIEPELCSLKYMSVDKAVQRILEMGAGTKLAKFDVEGVYRTVPVHPDDRGLLGMRWKGKTYSASSLKSGFF